MGSKFSTDCVPDPARHSSLSSRGRADCKGYAQSVGPVSQTFMLSFFSDVWRPVGLDFGAFCSSWTYLAATRGVENGLEHQGRARGRPRDERAK